MTIWKPDPVSIEPHTTLARWIVYSVPSKKGEGTDEHIVGYCNGEGRVSSTIVSWNLETREATTRSGRKYHLPSDAYGWNGDAQYVWARWLDIYKISLDKVKDVSEKYE